MRQELAFGIPVYGADFWKEYPILAFNDTVDRRGMHKRGICGEKVVVIDEKSAPFLSVRSNTEDPIYGNSTLVFDGTNLKQEDVGRKITVRYKVLLKDYPDNPQNRAFHQFDFFIAGSDDSSRNAVSAIQRHPETLEDHELFIRIPLAARLNQGVDNVKRLAER